MLLEFKVVVLNKMISKELIYYQYRRRGMPLTEVLKVGGVYFLFIFSSFS